jgi:hypothetical protein
MHKVADLLVTSNLGLDYHSPEPFVAVSPAIFLGGTYLTLI